jgi:hypothetical protein
MVKEAKLEYSSRATNIYKCIFNKDYSIWLPGELLSQLAPLTLYKHS